MDLNKKCADLFFNYLNCSSLHLFNHSVLRVDSWTKTSSFMVFLMFFEIFEVFLSTLMLLWCAQCLSVIYQSQDQHRRRRLKDTMGRNLTLLNMDVFNREKLQWLSPLPLSHPAKGKEVQPEWRILHKPLLSKRLHVILDVFISILNSVNVPSVRHCRQSSIASNFSLCCHLLCSWNVNLSIFFLYLRTFIL